MDGAARMKAEERTAADGIKVEAVTVADAPMLYVSQRIPMEPATIEKAIDHAMTELGSFMKEAGIAPAGRPVAVYRDYHEGVVTLDFGMPVPEAATEKASGEVMAGRTPAGAAQRAIHRGPYDTLVETYEALEDSGTLRPHALSWEVYVSDPANTAPNELVTEIYFAR
ncbi:MAG: GyrI-like domain-containing protein [Bauldia sp.]